MKNLHSPANEPVMRFLASRHADAPELAASDSMALPYTHAGCHPDTVERVWDQLAPALGPEARVLIHGTPCLVDPGTLLVLAVCIGTQYALRIPPGAQAHASELGLRHRVTWGPGDTLDATTALGPDWVFGTWRSEEPTWTAAVQAAAADSSKESPA